MIIVVLPPTYSIQNLKYVYIVLKPKNVILTTLCYVYYLKSGCQYISLSN